MKNTTKLFTLALLVATSFTAKAVTFTGDVSGQVIELESKQPVAFAEVVLENGSERISVTANEYGYYSAKQIPMGKYEIHVVYNNRSFVMNNVKVKDSNSSKVNFIVSSNENLPSKVSVSAKEQTIRAAHDSSPSEVVKYGSIIVDGKIIIIANKPSRLFA